MASMMSAPGQRSAWRTHPHAPIRCAATRWHSISRFGLTLTLDLCLTDFASLDLIEPLLRAVAEAGYVKPTPIQVRAIPPLLKGRDMIGCAQTGTGKTAAFALPVLQLLTEHSASRGRRVPRALVLSPTRELAAQIGESFRQYGTHLHVRHEVIFGGVSQKPQVRALERGLDVLVATPGRLLDLLNQGFVDLTHIEFFVLDEADRMLDMGFIHDVRRVLKVLPTKRQNLLFSATMPQAITELASSFLDDPVYVAVTPPSTTVERVEQQVRFVDRGNKPRLLIDLIQSMDVDRAIVFTRTKHGANRLATQLERAGIVAAAIHGNKSQNARTRALDGFRDGDVPILVATDIAARGIDVDGVSHVFNYDLPNIPESYVHRIGRTARAGRPGMAIAFCDESEGAFLRDIEREIGESIEVVLDHPYHCAAAVPPPARARRSAPVQVERRPSSRPAPRPPRDERSSSRPAREERPREERPHVERPREERPRAERPREERPREERPMSRPARDERPPSRPRSDVDSRPVRQEPDARAPRRSPAPAASSGGSSVSIGDFGGGESASERPRTHERQRRPTPGTPVSDGGRAPRSSESTAPAPRADGDAPRRRRRRRSGGGGRGEGGE